MAIRHGDRGSDVLRETYSSYFLGFGGDVAKRIEQNENNSLIRPLSAYNGEEQRSVPPKSF